jgi:hypothetical protein
MDAPGHWAMPTAPVGKKADTDVSDDVAAALLPLPTSPDTVSAMLTTVPSELSLGSLGDEAKVTSIKQIEPKSAASCTYYQTLLAITTLCIIIAASALAALPLARILHEPDTNDELADGPLPSVLRRAWIWPASLPGYFSPAPLGLATPALAPLATWTFPARMPHNVTNAVAALPWSRRTGASVGGAAKQIGGSLLAVLTPVWRADQIEANPDLYDLLLLDASFGF